MPIEGDPASQPRDILTAGVALLNNLMQGHGFVYAPTAVGTGSGGAYAAGEFQRGNRRLELSYRHSLGLVTYRVGELSLSQEVESLKNITPRLP